MKAKIREGWFLVRQHMFIAALLFLYQLIWGYFLYRMVQSAVVPLLLRYPEPDAGELSTILFKMESQLGLSTNPEVHRYLWILGAMLLLRMLISPLIQAGLLYSLQHFNHSEERVPFIRGIKNLWKPILLLHTIRTVLLLLPAYWLAPKLYSIFMDGFHSLQLLLPGIPYVAGWIVYGWVIHHALLYMQFGVSAPDGEGGARGTVQALWIALRQIITLIGIATLLGGLHLLVFGAFTSASWLVTGLTGLILQQTYPLARCLLSLWKICAHFRLWQSNSVKE
ncbi:MULTISPECIES: hypothetical protein [unclassified Paenibacillus]|uniref:hypothetical protein n=1 Tax=unclassified Paenibacillus TaxID=185978 RepID=UPI00041E1869|nr:MULTISPECIES: hypothetical protein [unclassified Paenibacillus]KGP84494.1 hypothetical protein P363_0123365 [Paenibacillus sp. MAEPY1]KGP84740.1 hypothetical protein P364_0103490 [Paenibacillus sp. MAEPY2]